MFSQILKDWKKHQLTDTIMTYLVISFFFYTHSYARNFMIEGPSSEAKLKGGTWHVTKLMLNYLLHIAYLNSRSLIIEKYIIYNTNHIRPCLYYVFNCNFLTSENFIIQIIWIKCWSHQFCWYDIIMKFRWNSEPL
jgi:hypothetical protein